MYCSGNLLIRSALTAGWLILLSACTTPNVGGLPSEASKNIGSFIHAAQDAQRASSALGWGNTVSIQQLGGKASEIDSFTSLICSPSFSHSAIAADVLQMHNANILELAKAPDASFGAYIRNIKNIDQSIAEIKSAPPPKTYTEIQSEIEKKCTPLVLKDLAISGEIAHKAIPLGAAADVLVTLFAIPAKIAQIAESQKRAEAVRAYVTAHELEMTTALDLLGKSHGLDGALQAIRTYYVRKAFSNYSELSIYRNNSSLLIYSPQIRAADTFAEFAAKYRTLQDVSGDKLIEAPNNGLRPAYTKFINAVKNSNLDPLTELDNFLLTLQTISDLGSAFNDYKTALSNAKQ